MSAALAVGGAIGLALGIGVSVATDLPLMPELGLGVGVLAGWVWTRRYARQG